MDLPIAFRPASCDRKLSPVEMVKSRHGHRDSPKARPPYCSSTYAAIEVTCPQSCRFKAEGCYVRAGFTGGMSARLDDAAIAQRMTPDDVTRIEAEWIKAAFDRGRIPQDGARGGRDLRLHVGGDVSSTQGARWLAEAAADWQRRGGGTVWTYTHRWRQIRRAAWGCINVLASVETEHDARAARARGYAPAITLRAFPSERTFRVGKLSVVPCPAETRGTTCVQCRLCLDRDLIAMRVAIGFALHGQRTRRVRRSLPVLACLPG
jgi:hypothetical protein